MENDDLLKLVLIISIIGLLLLSVIAYFSSPPEIKLSELENNLGRKVSVTGYVSKVSLKPNVSFITLSDGKNFVEIVFFDLPSDQIKKGDNLRIVGTIERYKGKIELLAEDIYYA